jgi:hypothetical protein
VGGGGGGRLFAGGAPPAQQGNVIGIGLGGGGAGYLGGLGLRRAAPKEEEDQTAPIPASVVPKFLAERREALRRFTLELLSGDLEGLDERDREEIDAILNPTQVEPEEEPAEPTDEQLAEEERLAAAEEIERAQITRLEDVALNLCHRGLLVQPEPDDGLAELLRSDRAVVRKVARIVEDRQNRDRQEALDEIRQEFGAANVDLVLGRADEFRRLVCERESLSI